MPNTSLAFKNSAGNWPSLVVDGGDEISAQGMNIIKSGEKIYIQIAGSQFVADSTTALTIDGGSALTGDMATKFAALQSGVQPGGPIYV